MLRFTICFMTLSLLVGCRAPVPSFNVLAPYGEARVPPPQTGVLGTPNGAYYTNPQQGTAPVSPQSYYVPERRLNRLVRVFPTNLPRDGVRLARLCQRRQ